MSSLYKLIPVFDVTSSRRIGELSVSMGQRHSSDKVWDLSQVGRQRCSTLDFESNKPVGGTQR